jgi:alpha-D-xyloside xylohydrolase
MFGRSILVCPVTESMYTRDGVEDFNSVKSIKVYLPRGAPIGLISGQVKNLMADKPYQKKHQSISCHYTSRQAQYYRSDLTYSMQQKKAGMLLISEFMKVPMANLFCMKTRTITTITKKECFLLSLSTWNDSNKTLTIGARKGSFPGMLSERKFNVVIVDDKNGTGLEPSEIFDKEIVYFGEEIEVTIIKD